MAPLPCSHFPAVITDTKSMLISRMKAQVERAGVFPFACFTFFFFGLGNRDFVKKYYLCFYFFFGIVCTIEIWDA